MADKKTALLLLPLQLTQNKNILRSIHVSKNAQGVKYDVADLDNTELRKYYHQLPNQAKHGLYQLTNEGLMQMEDEIIKRHKQQKSGVQLRQFLLPAYAKKLQEQFDFLKPFADLVKWYHQLPNPATGNMVTAPCIFSTYKPLLQFEVVKEGDHLQLVTIVTINGNDYKLSVFRRFHFLLESKNEYFLLTNKDYQTLDWLDNNNPQQYSTDNVLFANHILSRLEENYTVQRNNLFAVTTIEVTPRQRVLLSEISNSFLMLTPQWVYDGYVAEGEWKESFETTNNGEAIIIKRHKEIETAFKKQLEALHPNFVKQLNGWYYLSFADAQKKQWFLKVYHQLLEMDIELAGIDMLTHFRYSPHKPVTQMKVLTKDTNSLVVDFSLQFGEEKIPLAELQKMLIAGQRAVMLKDGSLGVLNDTWLEEYAIIIKHSKVDKKQLTVPQWMAVSEHKNEGAGQSLKITVSEDWWQNWQRWQQPGEVLYPISKKINATLRPYQQKGFEWLKMLAEINAGACLADDMGLGKTLQTICFMVDRLEQVTGGMVLIVCPSSLIYNWQQEINKFAPHLRTYVHHGQARDISNITADGMDVCITSYGTMRSDIEQLAALVFDVAVVDESHNIKNPAAQSTRAIYQLKVRSRIALSGTPVMNNTFDLYSQLEFLLPGMFGSKEFFKREYADAIDRDRNEEKIAMLQKLTAPFILRRTKEQVAKDLPEKTESILWCNMGMAQKDMYEGIKESIKSNLFLNIKTEGLGKSKLQVLQGIMKLKQVCSSPLLLPGEEQSASHSVKTEMLLEELANLGDHKVLVFSQFTKMLHLLAGIFTKKGISFYQLDGSTAPKQRAAMVADFQQADNTTNVFLISLMAGNTGLTLTAADYVFLFDPWWNNAVQQQAIDRTHRIGQTKNVFAYKMICKDTIEEKIIQLQQKKKELSDNLIGDNEGFVKQLSKEDVEFLFS
jgi:superfamily II DNA or RNA helicase